MKKTIQSALILLILLTATHLVADDKPVEFNDPIKKDRYYALIDEIRCLVCQNQSLADSNADLAQDLRNEVYEMVVKGKPDGEIHQFLTNRYGNFVLYRPPLQGNTWLLWFGPFILLLIAITVAIAIIKKQSNDTPKNISDEERHRLAAILDNNANGEKE